MNGQCWLIDLSSDLRLEEVLDKIIENALGALPGKDFALVLSDADGEIGAARSSGLSPAGRRLVTGWAEAAGALDDPQQVGDLRSVPELERLAMHAHGKGFAELASRPLRCDERGAGALVALAPADSPLGADDAATFAAYTAQAEIALSNALLFQRLVEHATEDQLTGLPNRRQFESLLRRELERSSRYGEVFSLVMIDLDGFKSVNDTHGHGEGDSLLRSVADRLRETCRTADVAARIGGDEFALILPATDQFEAAALCERLRTKIEGLGEVSLSWGVAEYPTHGTRRAELLKAADSAMYASKPRESREAA